MTNLTALLNLLGDFRSSEAAQEIGWPPKARSNKSYLSYLESLRRRQSDADADNILSYFTP